MIVKEAEIDVAELKCTASELEITWQNSSYSVYSSLWLRDNDPANRDPSTGQRLASLLDLPPSPRLQAAEPRPSGHLTLSWDDGETSVFPLSWLRAFDRSLHMTPRPMRLPWMGQPAEAFAWCDYAEWVENPASREDWLYYVGRDGLAFLRNLPNQEGNGESALLQRRRPHQSRGGDQRRPHLRSLHRSPKQTISVTQARAGLCTPAILIVIRCPASSCCIVSPRPAREAKASLWMEWRLPSACVPMIPTPSPSCPRRPFPIVFKMPQWNSLPSGPCSTSIPRESSAPSTTTTARSRRCRSRVRGSTSIYPAYRQLAQLLREPSRLVTYGWKPGDLVLFDNTRILHGHTAISIGSRHLQGCYLDADGLYSALAVLSRKRSLRGDDISA